MVVAKLYHSLEYVCMYVCMYVMPQYSCVVRYTNELVWTSPHVNH